MAAYTVRQATATGKNDVTYGAEYIVNFNEDQREVKLSRKQPVVAGQVENGTIVDGKYGAYFKKDPFVPGQPSQSPSPAPATTPASASKPAYKDNSDGMRQGMCINNAAAYISSWGVSDMTAKTWAEEVHSYASHLYSLGDLTPPEITNVFAEQ